MSRSVRRKIPKFDCIPNCKACCGPVPFGEQEKNEAAKRFPMVQWLPGKEDGTWVPQPLSDGHCAFSWNNRCNIYDIRPLVCALFGTVDTWSMKCPKGCGPSNLMSKAKSWQLMGEHYGVDASNAMTATGKNMVDERLNK